MAAVAGPAEDWICFLVVVKFSTGNYIPIYITAKEEGDLLEQKSKHTGHGRRRLCAYFSHLAYL